ATYVLVSRVRRAAGATLFPSTTLFRSEGGGQVVVVCGGHWSASYERRAGGGRLGQAVEGLAREIAVQVVGEERHRLVHVRVAEHRAFRGEYDPGVKP